MQASRIVSIDVARGLIMALMALDHVRMYFTSAQFDPVSIDETTFGYFATRWVTHLCAPGFFFLAGMGVALAERAGQSPRKSTFLLLTRGVWLVVLEFTLIGLAWSFVLGWSWLGVIWSLGVSMICLAALRWAPRPILLAAALAFTLLHNALPMTAWLADESVATIFYSAGSTTVMGLGEKWALFPILPWLALMVIGYTAADFFVPAASGRPSIVRLAGVGAVCVAAFAALRVLGIGQPDGGGAQTYGNAAQSLMSFMNVEKYPPSLQFSLVTIGVLLIATAFFEQWQKGAKGPLFPLLAFGRAPFFFYILHLYIIHGLALATASALSWSTDYGFWRGVGANLRPPEGYGFGLPGVYLVWLVVLLMLFPVCAWFTRIKASSGAWWTKYL